MQVFRNLDNLPSFKNAVVTIGSFDGLHLGHQQLLKKIKAAAESVDGEDVVITFDPHPRMVVKPNDKSLVLLNELDEKLELLKKSGVSNCVIVPFTMEFSQQSPESYIEDFIIKNFHPKVLVIGYDHKFGHNREGDFSLLQHYQRKGYFDLIKIEKEEIEQIAISSTKIRTAIQQGDITKANTFLGYPYFLTGAIVHGQQIGKTIGYPTANIKVRTPNKLIPKIGIYSCKLTIDQASYNGMMYIGPRPSIEDSDQVSIEVHIFDFNKDIYGKIVRVKFINYIRDDIKFNRLDELSNQLAKDEKEVKKQFKAMNSADNDPKVGVVVLNFNGLNVLKTYLKSLYESCIEYPFDLVVIDNGSTDNSVGYLKREHPEVQLICLGKNLGFAGGYNEGLKDLTYDYIALVNSDVEGTIGWLDPIISLFESNHKLGIAQPKIKSWSHKDEFEYAGAAGGYIDYIGYPFCRGRIFDTIEKDHGQYDDVVEIDWASGCAFVTRSSIFKELGGFDASYFAHMEEIDICLSAKKSGWQILAYNKTHVYHLGGGTLEYETPVKTYLNFKNNLATVLKNYSASSLLFVIPLRLMLDGIAGIKFLLEGRPKNTLSIVKAHFTFYAMIFSLIQKRKKIKAKTIHPLKLSSPVKSILWNYYIMKRNYFTKLK